MVAAIERERPALVFLAYPNNPTGNLFDAAAHGARPARGAGAGRRRRGVPRVRRRELPAAPRRVPEPRSCCARSRRSGWRGCAWATRSAAPEWIAEFDKVRPAVQSQRADAGGRAGAAGRAGDCSPSRRRRSRRSARASKRRSRACRASSVFPTQTNFVLARVPDAPRWFDAPARRRHPGEEPARLASAARALPAHHRRHARRERRAARGARNDYDRPRSRLPKPAPRRSSATPRRRRSPSRSTSTAAAAPSSRPACRSSTTCSTSSRGTGMLDLTVAREGRPPHRRAPHRRGHRHHARARRCAKALGDKTGLTRYGHAYVPLDEALSRVVIDLSGRPGLEFHVPFTRAMIGAFDVDLDARVLPGLRQPRAGHAAHRQPARPERPPPGRDRVQGVRARAARWPSRRDPRAAGVDPVDQGTLCSAILRAVAAATRSPRMIRHRRRRLRDGQPALGGEGARPRRARPRRSSSPPIRTSSGSAARVVLPGQSAMPDCMRGLDASGLARGGRRGGAHAAVPRHLPRPADAVRDERGGPDGRALGSCAGRVVAVSRRRDDAADGRAAQGAAHGVEPRAPDARASALGGHRGRHAASISRTAIIRCRPIRR